MIMVFCNLIVKVANNEVTGGGDATPLEDAVNDSYEIDVVNDHSDYRVVSEIRTCSKN